VRQVGLIDFRELRSGEELEDLARCLLETRPEVLSVETTGRGTDWGGDLLVRTAVAGPLGGRQEEKLAVVQCKHYAVSGKAVRQADLRIMETLVHYNADIFLLVTTTTPGSYWATIMSDISADKRNRGQRAVCWDATYLETVLLSEQNRGLLRRFFPVSYKRATRVAKENAASLRASTASVAKAARIAPPQAEAVSGGSTKVQHTDRLYIITSLEERQPVGAASLRAYAGRLGVQITTSHDVPASSLWTEDQAQQIDRLCRRSDAIFAVVSKRGSHSPNVWIEIERAMSTGKLKAVFIAESAYTVTSMSFYPCVLIKRDVQQSIDDFVAFFRGVFQQWGKRSDRWFWCGLATILMQHDFPVVAEVKHA